MNSFIELEIKERNYLIVYLLSVRLLMSEHQLHKKKIPLQVNSATEYIFVFEATY